MFIDPSGHSFEQVLNDLWELAQKLLVGYVKAEVKNTLQERFSDYPEGAKAFEYLSNNDPTFKMICGKLGFTLTGKTLNDLESQQLFWGGYTDWMNMIGVELIFKSLPQVVRSVRKDGKLITVWGKQDFDENMINIVFQLFGGG